MPPGETMFKYHGYSGPCPKPPLPREETAADRIAQLEAALRVALPILDEAYRWHRDMQSAPSRVDEAYSAKESARAALEDRT
jgi:hypothetical protein